MEECSAVINGNISVIKIKQYYFHMFQVYGYMQVVWIKHFISSFRKMWLGTLRWLVLDPSRTCLGLMCVTTTQQSITAMQIQACNEFVLFSLLVCHGAMVGGGSHSPQLQ